MSEVFGAAYAETYDLLYRDKDYRSECDLVERVFQTHGDGSTHTILDVGCGTGGHAVILAGRGYRVTGVDRSQEMLAQARDKAVALSGDAQVSFLEGRVGDLNLERRFDAALMMFAVLGYQTENAEVVSALINIRRHLRAGGLFLFDVWYGPAVLSQRPSERLKVIPTSNGQIIRAASAEMNARRHLCTVSYKIWQLEDGRLVTHAEEAHAMRYFFPLELEHLLECCGFSLVRLGGFPDFEREPDETTWNVMCVAQAV